VEPKTVERGTNPVESAAMRGASRRLLLLLLLPLLPVAVLAALALQNYVQELREPEYDPSVHQLVALERPGSGPRVLLLHGLAASNAYWERTIPLLPPSLHVLAPDLLGFGGSPKPRASYDLGTQIQALDQLLTHKEFLDGEPLVIVGHSLGSIVALAWAQAHPGRVRALVLVSLPYYPSREQAEAQLSRVSWMHRGMLTRNPALELLCYGIHGRDIPFLSELTGLPPDVASDGVEHTWMSLSGSLRNAILAVDVGALARNAPVPLTLLHGEQDQVVPAANVEALARKLPRTPELLEIPSAGHDLPLSHPERIVEQILRAIGNGSGAEARPDPAGRSDGAGQPESRPDDPPSPTSP